MITQQTTLSDPLTGILALLGKVKQTAPNQWKALCPAHDDHTPSLSVTQDHGTVLIKCHAGCSTEEIVSAMGLSMADLYTKKSNLKVSEIRKNSPQEWTLKDNQSDSRQIVAEYDYTDASGTLLYQVVRYDPKDFRQRHPDESGGWIWNMRGIQRVLYRLPDIIAADPDTWIFIVEGEKDTDSLVALGFAATTNPGGAGKWGNLSDVSVLQGRRVAIIPDRDKPGRLHAEDIATRLQGIAEDVCVVDLGICEDFLGKDISDWLEYFDTKNPKHLTQALLEMVDSSPQWSAEQWKAPVQVRADTGEPPIFPVDVLPKWLRDMVKGVAVTTQVPVEAVGSIGLAVVALTGAGRVMVEILPDWREPLCLFVAVALPSACRKSSVFSMLKEPLDNWEKAEFKRLAPEIALAKTDKDILELRLHNLKKKAGNRDHKAEEEARSLSVELSKRNDPITPRLYTSDVTPESIVRQLTEQNGRLGNLSAEGGELIATLSGRYSNKGQMNIEVFLKGHAGDSIRVDRADRTRAPITINHPALTIALCLQPSVLEGIFQRKEFEDRGLLARFMFVLPKNPMGGRDVDALSISVQVKTEYEKYIMNLLNQPRIMEMNNQPERLTLKPEALELLKEFMRDLEPKLGPGGQYEHMSAWAGKLAGLIARLAGVLHLASNPENPAPWLEPISAATMIGALALGSFYRKQAERVYGIFGGTPESRMALRILNWLKRTQTKKFKQRNLYRELGVKSMDIQEALRLLEDTNYIRLMVTKSIGQEGKFGRKPSPIWEVNPAVHMHSVDIVNYIAGVQK